MKQKSEWVVNSVQVMFFLGCIVAGLLLVQAPVRAGQTAVQGNVYVFGEKDDSYDYSTKKTYRSTHKKD